MRVSGNKIFGRTVNIGEVAAATAGDQDFFADAIGVFKNSDAATAFACFDGAHQASGTRAENQSVEVARQERPEFWSECDCSIMQRKNSTAETLQRKIQSTQVIAGRCIG